ncbi:hypothetical protein VQ049_13425, partial [Staphylococcus arlettae]
GADAHQVTGDRADRAARGHEKQLVHEGPYAPSGPERQASREVPLSFRDLFQGKPRRKPCFNTRD